MTEPKKTQSPMQLICTDLEGVLVPEIWINVAQKTGIEELRLTTRDIPDYDVLMQKRLAILKRYSINLRDITDVIATMEPLEGALEFLEWVRSRVQIVIVSDTFTQFAGPLMQKLGWPTLYCNTLQVNGDGSVTGYILRQPDAKRQVVKAMRELRYEVIAMGDSYNDLTMLETADHGILYRPPETIRNEYNHFPVAQTYADLETLLSERLDPISFLVS